MNPQESFFLCHLYYVFCKTFISRTINLPRNEKKKLEKIVLILRPQPRRAPKDFDDVRLHGGARNNPDSRREKKVVAGKFANFSSRPFMLARKDRTEIASSFKVAMNDLTDLNFLGRKFLSDEKPKRSSIFLRVKEGK